MRAKRILAVLLSIVMVLGMMPVGVSAAHDHSGHLHPMQTEFPVPVTTEGNTYSLFTEENLEGQYGTTFLYVVKRNGRFYTPAHPHVSGFAEVDSVASVDITAYWDEETNTFSGIPDSANVGVMMYQSYPEPGYYDSALYLDGNIMLSLSVPSVEEGETWFDGGIRYYDRSETYSYSRALWEANGDGGGYFYDRYTDWWGDDSTVYGVLALNSDFRFAVRNFSEEFEAEQTIDVNAYLYAAPCSHPITRYSAYDAPTCMDKGCEEYWYCVYCDNYFADAQYNECIGHKPVLPALDHDYGDTACVNCGQPIPVYTRITSYEQFRTVDPNASFIAVAQVGEAYFVLKKEIATTMADIDEDEQPDILQLDENGNGQPDILETDENGDGVADVMDFDGIYTGEPDGVLDSEEIWEYLFHLENQYTDGYIPGLHVLGAIPVTPAQDGTISVKDLGALEWIMERVIPDEQLADQYYGEGYTVKDYENDFLFRIPNFWIRPVVSVSNNYYQQPYEQGDSKWWGVLFGRDGKELNEYLWEPFFDESFPDDAAVLFTESFHSLNAEGQLEHALRFLVNGEDKNFIMTSDSFWEELEGTVYPIYLYCSDPGKETHIHIWGPWNPGTEEVHKRVCTVEGCTAFDYAAHAPGEECTPDPEHYELGHWVTCTECGGQIHEYHTRESAGRYYPNYWRDTGDGIHHVVNCTECLGPVEYAEHDWSEWYAGAMQIDGEWIMGHYQSCDDWPCEASKWQAECIYDEGTVIQEPTCTESGLIRYVCQGESCQLDTRTHTEEIPALGHDWGDWEATDDSAREQRVCKHDSSHVEYRDAEIHEHTWSDWTDDEVSDTHSRTCQDPQCAQTETEPHTYEDEVHGATCTEQGYTTHTCTKCGKTYTDGYEASTGHTYEEIRTQDPTCTEDGFTEFGCTHCDDTYREEIPATGHNFGDWFINRAATCTEDGESRRNCGNCSHYETEVIPATGHKHEAVVTEPTCTEGGYTTYTCHCGDSYIDDRTEPLGHDWDEGVVTVEPTEETEGEMTYTCRRCQETHTEPIPALEHKHSYEETVTEPTCTEQGYTTYTCRCGDSYVDSYTDALGHDFGNWYTVEDPTCTEEGLEQRDCARCKHRETQKIDALGHKHESVVTEPTCTEQGYTTHTCHCGDSYVDSYTDALGHDFGEWIPARKPTHLTEGLEIRTCGRCALEESREVPRLENDFTDVPEGSFYYEAVLWAVDNGITNGTAESTFSPDENCVRAQVVTFLWRVAGSPEPVSGSNPFVDVTQDDYYYKAVLWAVEQGITNGLDKTHFGPLEPCSRSQAVTFLWRAQGKPEPAGQEMPFADVQPGEFYEKAVHWAVEQGITNGMSANIFGVEEICCRSHIVVFLYRTYK